jgi:hypothetical protein
MLAHDVIWSALMNRVGVVAGGLAVLDALIKGAASLGSIGLSTLTWFFDGLLFHVVPQSPMPGLQSLGRSLP